MKVCGLYSLRDVDEFRLNIKNEVNKLSGSHLFYLHNRYNQGATHEFSLSDKINRLTTYTGILGRVKEQTLAGDTPCLDSVDLQCLIEKVVGIVGKNCISEQCDYAIDTTSEEEWVIKNPFCRTYEDWEKWAKIFSGKLNLEVNAETEVLAKLMLEISREVITPNVLLAISAYTEARTNLNLQIDRTDEEIKLDFQLLLEGTPTCDLTPDTYGKMVRSCKLSFDIIKTVYEEGLSLQLQGEEVQLKTPVNAYTLSQISGKIDPSYLEQFGMKATINKNNLLQDYK